ncbi:AI-2E family transporter [Thiohalorhabdus sp. Cl-TMA]|uniref:AI-2E family transporter n=1 Tax=Thiohalorhabdus methylotrophus TaxID=3242694 RepID=A0ABV4TRP9_9GAMM
MQSARPSFRSLFPGAAPSLLGAAAVVGLLYIGSNVLIPIVVAALLSSLLAPVAGQLERLHLGRIGSALLIAVFLAIFAASVAGVVSRQVVVLADALPDYRSNIVQRIEGIQAQGSTVLSRALTAFRNMRREVTEEEGRGAPARGQGNAEPETREPIPVQIREEPTSEVLGIIRNYGSALLQPIGMAGLAFIYLIFFLVYREDLRERVIRLAGISQINVTSDALDEASRKISHFLRAQVIINVTYGIPVGVGLWFLGVPNAALWGILATLLRFIPYLGPWVGAGLPVLLSLAVFDGWIRPLEVLGLFLVLELISNNIVEPWLYGASTGLSPVAVLFAVVFWSALWGLVGLVVAIPLTACLVVLGRYVPALQFLPVMLGREPALPPSAGLYYRLFAADTETAARLLAEYREEHGLEATLDEVVLPAMRLVRQHHSQGSLDRRRMVEMVEMAEQAIAPLFPGGAFPEPSTEFPRPPDLICIAAYDEIDELLARLLAALLRGEGARTAYVPTGILAGELASRIPGTHRSVLCITTIHPPDTYRVRYLCKRIRHRRPGWPLLVGAWGAERETGRALREAGADQIAGSLEASRHWIQRKLEEIETLESGRAPTPRMDSEQG